MVTVKDLSTKEATKLARDFWRRAPGMQPAMMRLLYHVLTNDERNDEANYLFVLLVDSIADDASSIALSDYFIDNDIIQEEKLKTRVRAESIVRFYRLGLARHQSGSSEFEMEEFDSPAQFVFEQKRIDELREDAAKQYGNLRSVFESMRTLLGLKSGLIKHKSLGSEVSPDELRFAEHFEKTEEYDRFLNSENLQIVEK